MRFASTIQHDSPETEVKGVITGRIAILHDRLYYGDLTSQERGEVVEQIEEWRERLVPPSRPAQAEPVQDDPLFWPIDVGGEG